MARRDDRQDDLTGLRKLTEGHSARDNRGSRASGGASTPGATTARPKERKRNLVHAAVVAIRRHLESPATQLARGAARRRVPEPLWAVGRARAGAAARPVGQSWRRRDTAGRDGRTGRRRSAQPGSWRGKRRRRCAGARAAARATASRRSGAHHAGQRRPTERFSYRPRHTDWSNGRYGACARGFSAGGRTGGRTAGAHGRRQSNRRGRNTAFDHEHRPVCRLFERKRRRRRSGSLRQRPVLLYDYLGRRHRGERWLCNDRFAGLCGIAHLGLVRRQPHVRGQRCLYGDGLPQRHPRQHGQRLIERDGTERRAHAHRGARPDRE